MPEKSKEPGSTFSPANQLASWARQGVGSVMAAQRILLDLTAQQNALLIGMLRERLSEPIRPGATLTKIADKGVENVTGAWKIMLDLVAAETDVVVDGVKELVPLPGAAGTVANLLRHRVLSLIDLEKHFVDAAAEQTHKATASYREGKGLLEAGASMAALVRRGIEEVVSNEKKFLDMVVHEVSAANKPEHESRKPTRERYKVLAQAARETGEVYFEAQRKLLNLAVEQMESVGKEVAGALHRGSEGNGGHTSLGDLTEKSVKNFVSAQKSLMELVVKPTKAASKVHAEPKRKAVRVRPRPSKEVVHEAPVV